VGVQSERHGVFTQTLVLGRFRHFYFQKGTFTMKQVIDQLINFTQDESGATAIEYGLLAALVALGITVGATALGAELGLFFGRIATRLSTAN
jgi:pilus assembly protein Flp/PilA